MVSDLHPLVMLLSCDQNGKTCTNKALRTSLWQLFQLHKSPRDEAFRDEALSGETSTGQLEV